MNRPGPLVPLLVLVALVAAACGGGPSPSPRPAALGLSASVASYDLSADRPLRVMVGLQTADGRLLNYGSVSFAFSFLGATQATGTPVPGPTAEAAYLPVPGTAVAGAPDRPELTGAAQARGVYAAEGVELSRAGIWQVDVTGDASGTLIAATTTFTVAAHPVVPAPGQPALRTVNHVLGEKGIPPEAIDSMAAQLGEIPDPELHRTTIASAIAHHRVALVVFSTPAYCISKFCGPITDIVDGLAKANAGKADFIHIEIWRNFQAHPPVVNKAAADWLLHNDDLQEPWIFLIGRDGRIAERWDNLADPADVATALAKALR